MTKNVLNKVGFSRAVCAAAASNVPLIFASNASAQLAGAGN